MPLVGEVPPPPPAKTPSTRTRTASPKSTKLADQSPSKIEERTKTLLEFASVGQGAMLMMGQYADAETVETFAPPFLSAVAKLGDTYPQLGESIDKAEGVGPIFAVFAAAVPMALQFMANHGRLDASKIGFGGIKDPAVLHNRQAAKVMQAQADMLSERRESEEAARAAQARMHSEVQAMQSLMEPAGA